jgi:pyruvate/2-oxoglutarate dehydrogenase complex dihydrolipoamide acyltransferase (E2) component
VLAERRCAAHGLALERGEPERRARRQIAAHAGLVNVLEERVGRGAARVFGDQLAEGLVRPPGYAGAGEQLADGREVAGREPGAQQRGDQVASLEATGFGREVVAGGLLDVAAGLVDPGRVPQQTVGRRMAESKATAPDFSISLTVDMMRAVELRAQLKEMADPAPSFNDMVVKAAATALTEHPRVNGVYRDGTWELYERVNVGVAVAAPGALVVPTVFDADRKSLGQIARDARALAEKVRDRTITPPELSGATFTVSNLGMYGIEQFVAIVNPPQAAILAVGKLARQPAVDDTGRIVARDQMSLSLVCDHRILYGADGAKFLARVKELLEQPLSLTLDSSVIASRYVAWG